MDPAEAHLEGDHEDGLLADPLFLRELPVHAAHVLLLQLRNRNRR
jgi:hypothetical protein